MVDWLLFSWLAGCCFQGRLVVVLVVGLLLFSRIPRCCVALCLLSFCCLPIIMSARDLLSKTEVVKYHSKILSKDYTIFAY